MVNQPQSRLNQIKSHVSPSINKCSAQLSLYDSKSSLQEERANPSFPVLELTHFLNGGEHITELKEKIMLQLERDPAWKLSDQPNLSLEQIRERTLDKARSIISYLAAEPLKNFKLRMEVISYTDPAFYTRFGVHSGLFLGAIQGQATPNQLQYWIKKGAITLNGVTGCFAMTELGHGSNVAALETTATFDESSDEFIIHTPTLTATKWWIGGAAQTATHSAVYAQLIVKGKRHGVKTFIVPLRDSKDFKLRPGVNIGDCGKKMGRDGIDNGYIQFTHVRIPRQYMLMKHTQVTRTGEVRDPPLAQLAYGALISGRVSMVIDSATFASKALTIAIRYGAIRRQFSSKPGTPETKLLDYPIHQHRLFPLLALTFALHFTGRAVAASHADLMRRMDSLTPESKDLPEVLDSLKEVHSTSAGLKAFGTWNALNLIEECRQTLGGHGYSAYTGLANMYQDFAIQCTWEGDNTILTLQLGRYLISSYLQYKKKGGSLAAGISYFNLIKDGKLSKVAKPDNDPFSIENMVKAWDIVSASAVLNAVKVFETARASGLSTEQAYEKASVERLKAAKLHCQAFTLKKFAEGLTRAPLSLQDIMTRLCQLHGCHITHENSGHLLSTGYFNGEDIQQLSLKVTELMEQIRPQAVNLVDGFGFSDYVINSPFGRYDGDIYQAYFDLVKQNNPQTKRPAYFESTIQPILQATYNVETDLELEIDDESN
ncbi:acyl-CoA oxidase [Neoconidiobolus thromboides FSU 785]|nr:acyl-CoA oxidase [Neoconidiobolus thromboides FSU 785]